MLELGSAASSGLQTHRSLFDQEPHTYFGVDVQAGPTVEAVMGQP